MRGERGMDSRDFKELPDRLRGLDKWMVQLTDKIMDVKELHTPKAGKLLIGVFILIYPVYQFWGIMSNIRIGQGITILGVLLALVSLGVAGWTAKMSVLDIDSDLSMGELGVDSKLFVRSVLLGNIFIGINQLWAGGVGLIVLMVIGVSCYVYAFIGRYYIGVVYDGLEAHPDTQYDGSREYSENEDTFGEYHIEYYDEDELSEVDRLDEDNDIVWNETVRKIQSASEAHRELSRRK
jgi:hypothetical protein